MNGHVHEKTASLQLRIDCPSCGAVRCESMAEELHERLLLWHALPVFSKRTTFVACGACGTRFVSRLPLAEIAALEPAQVGPQLRAVIPLPRLVLFWCSAYLCWLPLVGLLVAIPAHLAMPRSRPGFRRAAFAFAAIGALWTLFVVGLVAYAWLRRRR